jgi:hypothetical protein
MSSKPAEMINETDKNVDLLTAVALGENTRCVLDWLGRKD